MERPQEWTKSFHLCQVVGNIRPPSPSPPRVAPLRTARMTPLPSCGDPARVHGRGQTAAAGGPGTPRHHGAPVASAVKIDHRFEDRAVVVLPAVDQVRLDERGDDDAGHTRAEPVELEVPGPPDGGRIARGSRGGRKDMI